VLRTALVAASLSMGSACSGALGDPTPPVAAEPMMELALGHATVDELAEAISAAGVPVVVDARASMIASCVHVTVRTGGPVPRAQAYALVTRALDRTGLELEGAPEGWVVRLSAAQRPPSSCMEHVIGELMGSAARRDLRVAAMDAVGSPPGDAPAGGEPQAAAPAPSAEAVLAGITRTSDTEVTITQSALDRALEDQALLMRSVRVVPHLRDGQASGLRLFGIRAASLPAALGFQNGDIVLGVGGHSLISPESALDAYANLRGAERIPVQLERRGEPLLLTIRVVPEGGVAPGARAVPEVDRPARRR
jgi:hypothetical protein